MNIELSVLYLSLFLFIVLSAREWRWLVATLILCVVVWLFSSHYMQGLYHISTHTSICLSPWCAVVGSAFYWIDTKASSSKLSLLKTGQWQKAGVAKQSAFLFAVTVAVVALTALLILLCLFLLYQSGHYSLGVYFFCAWLEVFLLQPLFWLAMQGVLVILFLSYLYWIQQDDIKRGIQMLFYTGVSIIFLCTMVYVILSLA